MADKKNFPVSGLPIRRNSDFLPEIFRTDANKKFFAGVFDPLTQPGVVDKIVGYLGRRYGKTYNNNDTYLDSDETLRSRYQLEPGVVVEKDQKIEKFYDFLDQKNILKFFGNDIERDDKTFSQEHYTWNPPIDWDKFTNYREYFWVPSGPPSVTLQGQAASVTSTYKVRTSVGSSWIFTPDGATNNPNLVLYRGQTYNFEVNSTEGFTIRTNYDTGSLNYDPDRTYFPNELAVFNGNLWRAKVEVSPADGSTITEESQDWELLDSSTSNTALLYNKGITNNGIKKGTLKFEVPMDAPDLLYYQSDVDPNRVGQFVIADIDTNTFLDVEKDVIGKKTYKSANEIQLTNGLVVEFSGTTLPEKYQEGTWLVEGVGKEITLTRFSDLVPPQVTIDTPEILFDNEGFDTQPFDDASQYPSAKDYITIARNSKDSNPWSRYNRWFHRSVLEFAFNQRNSSFEATESSRAKRPIIEFHPNIQLYNHGTVAKQTVDYVDTFTTDVFSNIEGSLGYNIDGEFLFEGARVLVIADTDGLANNKIYEVKFIIHNGRRQITLRETADSDSLLNECVLVRRGRDNAGIMYHYNGTAWITSQPKTSVNQAPLFEMFDKDNNAFSDTTSYPVSTFVGTKIISYTQGNGRIDRELGFSLSYLNIDNVGDIEFDWNLDKDTFTYASGQDTISKNINTGYLKINGEFDNGWTSLALDYQMPLIDTYVVPEESNEIILNTVDWGLLTGNEKIIFYTNGVKETATYERIGSLFRFDKTFNQKDAVSVKIISELEPVEGYYEMPIGLEKNPLNSNIKKFTLGQATDHVKTSLEFNDDFTGVLPGVSNLRDLSNFQVHAKRFVKHSGIAPASIALLNDKNINLIKSIQFARNAYTVFKNNFLLKSTEVEYTDNIPDLVDRILERLNKTKSINSPFADSDMVGTGAYNSLDYTVEDVGIKTFALSEKFNLESLSRRAVYVYINNVQLLNGTEYTFDSNFGFVTILKDLNENDEIQIREYISTSFSHIPPTPTALGLYKKYTPMKFLDDTYREPQYVLQGHDGSIQIAYNDYRDDLILELEYRIYNNIKSEYNSAVFDIDAVLGGYYGNSEYNIKDINDIINQEFLRWVSNTNLGYVQNTYFIENEPFTYTYNLMADPTGTENLPGYWRGVYRYFYDTDRPHRCPWECLGFSEKPDWWEAEYGPAPYTNGNLILWDDIKDGIIRHGPREGSYPRYARSSITSHIPVDADGNLVDPLTSGLATNFTLQNNKNSFRLGDVGPVEYAWKSSSEYPFALCSALCLIKPFDFIIENFDKNKTTRNTVGQIVSKETDVFITKDDLTLPVAGSDDLQSGLGFYVSAYIKSKGQDVSVGQDILSNLNVKLSTRMSGFVDKEQQKFLTDSKNPNSSTSSTFVPPENFDIIFNVGSPIASIAYSGVILEKSDRGWIVNGYNDLEPYFRYFSAIPNQKDPVISVGGISETFTVWEDNQKYNNGAIVEYRNDYWRTTQTHTSTTEFDKSLWQKLPALPVINATVAQRRRNFNTTVVRKLSYGEQLTSIQEVVDFLLGYQEFLKFQGFIFENYDPRNQVVQDWITSAKEFMFWTKHNWAVGSLITLSPGAQRLEINVPVGVADNILDSFYDYNVLTDKGTTIDTKNIDVSRDFQKFVINTTDTTEGIYYLKVNYVLKEHIAVFDDRTVFNDVIFDKPTGYRQERIKAQGFRTVDWDGDYTSPGFLFDNVKINVWQPFRNYKLGDIVAYRSRNYTSRYNHTSGENFDQNDWTILDSTPEKQLIPNYDYRINQIEDYFDVDTDGLGKSQRDLARHTIGYQTRQYLEALAEDPTTQYKIYQGYIREKGTSNSISKLFDKINGSGEPSVSLDEEWAFRVGRLGGIDQSYNVELKFQTDQFVVNPQPVLLTDDERINPDRYYRIGKSGFDFATVPFTYDINPVSYESKPVKTAGYVKIGQTQYNIKTRDDLSNLDVDSLQNNDHIWVTFDGPSWTVLRANFAYDLPITSVEIASNTITIGFARRHNKAVDDFIGIKGIDQISGIHKINAVTNFTVSFDIEKKATDDIFDPSSQSYPAFFTEARFPDYESLSPEHVALLEDGSKIYVDNNGNDKWEVIEKNKSYLDKKIENFGLSDPDRAGEKVVYSDILKQTLVSIPHSGYVISYVETPTGLDLKQIIEPLSGFRDEVLGTFGKELAISPDSKWLVVGSPLASGITSNYKGAFNPSFSYVTGDIVLYNGKLYKALKTIAGDGSTINVYSEDWQYVKNIDALESGSDSGKTQQGMISLYEFSANQWNLRHNFISPRPDNYEYFGSKITLGIADDGAYIMAVSAPGSKLNKGRVYLYKYENSVWELIENPNYQGVYDNDPSKFYPKGSTVWYDGYLWQALEDNYGDGSTINIDSVDWLRLDPVSTENSLPQSVSIDLAEDNSTLFAGLLSPDQVAELIMEGDQFGSSMAMSYDGSVIVVGAPDSDRQYFANYKGLWRPDYEYRQGDVVKYQDSYHQLENVGPSAVDDGSTIRSYNEEPDRGYPWVNVGDSSSEATGKIFIYRRNENYGYELIQTIAAESLADISDLDVNEQINSGDQFGKSIAIDYSGTTIVVTSPKADINFQNQGSAYVFKYDSDSTGTQNFRLKQKLQSYDKFPNEFFGQDVCISSNTEIIAIGASNSPFVLPTIFDNSGTSFDNKRTTFKSYSGFAGAVYVYELKGDTYYLSEKLESNLSLNESFGYSISCTKDIIAVGSPNYISPAPHGVQIAFEGPKTGMARLFKKDPNVKPFEILNTQPQTVDIEQIKRISLYDNNSDEKIQDLEIVDPAKLKILAAAERELSFKTPFDPAVYSVGNPDEHIVDDQISWTTKNIGKLWWDIGNAKWIDYEQGDISYRSTNWGTLAEGSSIDIYEWVESKLRPSEWSAIADTNEGLQVGISGQPLYPDNTAYSQKILYNNNTGQPTETRYYFWVRNKLIKPKNVVGRSISASTVASLIREPFSVGNTFIALADSNKFIVYNYTSIVSNDYSVLNIEFYNSKERKNAVHREYQLLTEGVADSIPAGKLEQKWLDSLIGYDRQGNRVPDTDLPSKQKYGVEYRPRQSMFVNNRKILETTIKKINSVLKKEAFADVISYANLNLVDQPPAQILNLYDTSVTGIDDLSNVGTIRVRKAELRANIIDGEVVSIDVLDPGYGYRVAPTLDFEGDGVGVQANTVIDNQGRVSSVNVTSRGRRYNSLIAKVRNFSVLVETDRTANNFWSIYAWDDVRKTFFRSASQSFDTTRYWSKIDWWAEGYSPNSRIVKEILSVYEEPSINLDIGDLLRIKEYGTGGWAVFEKLDTTGNTLLENYKLVGRKNGTIELSDRLYDTTTSGIGYDIVDSFDAGVYDKEVSNELRNIFKAVKEDIFRNEYAVEWNILFFIAVRYVLEEQTYVDWAFKTSFLNAAYKVGKLEQKLNYKNDSLDSYLEYINEVKPFRTTIREYKSIYDSLDTANTAVSDYDLPPYFNEAQGEIIPVTETDDVLQNYPYRFYSDNKGYEIVEIDISNSGSGYTSVPKVVIQGNGTGAKATAFISNGRVSGIKLENSGSGYTQTPTVSLVGGNGNNADVAKAVAILGNTKVRTLDIKMKLDRITKDGVFNNFNFNQTFTATGSSSVFELSYPCDIEKSKITIIRDGQLVLDNEYNVSLYRQNIDNFNQLKAKITFIEVPTAGSAINITYEKNDEILDSVNRIQKYYAPVSGMKGTDLDQLMTGIDYGGVQVQGTTFDVTGGWDALPWFTDSWDSVEAAADYYLVCDGSTTSVTLPYIPGDGQELNIYLKRVGTASPRTVDDLQYSEQIEEPKAVRIDDPNYTDAWDSSIATNPAAQMPTFIGDGSTQVIEIGQYIQTNPGDILIFRPISSDGSVTINDPNLVDTKISGGTLETLNQAYSTAQGNTPEEIAIIGGSFISPENVPAPEENIPGQVLDSLSIKVFQTTGSGAAPLQSKVQNADGTTVRYNIGQNILESNSVLVYVDGIKLDTDQYIVDLVENVVELDTAPDAGKLVEILSIGIGGVSLLDYQEFTADGETNLFLTNAPFELTANVFVSVNGEIQDVGFINSTGVVDTPNRTLVQFGITPDRNSTIKIVCLAASSDVDSTNLAVVRINRQEIVYDGSTRSYDLDNFVQLTRESAVSSMVVTVNGTKLKGVDTIYAVYDGTNNSFTLGTDPFEASGAILTDNISVFVNDERKIFIQDYVYNGTTKVLEIDTAKLTVGDVIKIENDFRSQYSVLENNLVIDSGVTLTTGDVIDVTWFGEYPSMSVVSDRFTGGKSVFELPFKPLSVSYVWVYKNGQRLKQDVEYVVDLPRGVLRVLSGTVPADEITVTMFGTEIFKLPRAYEINKDMLNVYRYNRFSANTEIRLEKDLNYFDTEIEVTNGHLLAEPIVGRNVAGVVIINNERIQYLEKEGNILRKLRRGALGTAIKELHSKDDLVVDAGAPESIPYNDTQDRTDFVSDGSSQLIGPLDFIPVQSSDPNWYRDTIPTDFGRCDMIEVFAGGKRLRKNSLTVFDESLGANSPSADKQVEAEFAVDGVSAYIRLTKPIPAGTRISILRKLGQTWYDKGTATATSGVTLLDNNTAISKFIAAKSTRLPE